MRNKIQSNVPFLRITLKRPPKQYLRLNGVWIFTGISKGAHLFRFWKILKASQNKKVQKNFQVHRFWCLFLQLAADKKTPKRCTWKFFWPFLFWNGFKKIIAGFKIIVQQCSDLFSYLNMNIFLFFWNFDNWLYISFFKGGNWHDSRNRQSVAR